MGSFKLGGMTFWLPCSKNPRRRFIPSRPSRCSAGLKGHIHNDVTDCILCSLCQKTCPTGAIVVDKSVRRWAIDPFRCVQCSSCVRACPKSCLHMLPTYTKVSTTQFCNVFEVPDPKKPKPAESKKAPGGVGLPEPDKHGLIEK